MRRGVRRALQGALLVTATAAAGACTAISGVNNLEKVSCLDCADAGSDAATVVDCTGRPDGTSCATSSVCLAGACVTSSCGDGFIDRAGGEQCEDGNEVSGDGCSACRFDCNADIDCNDNNGCTSETCDLSSATKHLCVTAIATNSPSCTIEGVAGVCKGPTCVRPGCGNALTEGTEECDDGNADDTDGCRTDCTFTCETAAECNDNDACNGVEACDVTTHKCVAGTAVSCVVDGKPECTGTCDSATGLCSYTDVDKDGAGCNIDCNDGDPAMFPGAFECKDLKDNDCNPATVDSSAPSCLCYRDSDKDGYAVPSAESVAAPATDCPSGYTRREPKSGDATTLDCNDRAASARPQQTSYFASGYCTGLVYYDLMGNPVCSSSWSYDYDCDGAETKRYPSAAATSCTRIGGPIGTPLCIGSGWTGSVPACGQGGTYKTCAHFAPLDTCVSTTATRTQECR